MMNSNLVRSCMKGSSSLLRSSSCSESIRSATVASAGRLSQTGLSVGGGGSRMIRPTTMVRAAFFHSGKPSLAAGQGKEAIAAFITEEMIAEMEYHHERRDGNDLNLLLQHPSTPKIMGWHPDLAFESDLFGDSWENSSLPEGDSTDEEEGVTATSTATTATKPTKMSFMNRNARYGSKASKGKRPCSRQARRRKKRAIGNPRR